MAGATSTGKRPAALDASTMEYQNLNSGNADDKALADASAVHAVNQILQSLRIVRQENKIIKLPYKRYMAASVYHQAKPRRCGAHVLMQDIKDDATKPGSERTALALIRCPPKITS